MNNKYEERLTQLLKEQPQMLPNQDGFDAIMDQVNQHQRSRSFRIPAIAAAILAAVLLWQLPKLTSNPTADQFEQLALLNEKIALIETVVRNEVINHSAPGSQILEKMVSMENWLDQLDENIAQTNDPNQKLELLHAKLEILDDLVALHKKYKPQEPTQLI